MVRLSQSEPPVLGQPRTERADAARNRRRVLEAASTLIAQRGPEAVAMDDVAELAGARSLERLWLARA